MSSSTEILEKLKSKSRSDRLEGMARYGIKTDKRLGVSIPDIRKIAKDFGKNHEIALELWKTGYADCLLYTSPSPRDRQKSRMPSSA